MDIILHLQPIIPEFIIMVEQVLHKNIEASHITRFYSEIKDYKINLLFDIFSIISQEKNNL
jgi:hypothetical protein